MFPWVEEALNAPLGCATGSLGVLLTQQRIGTIASGSVSINSETVWRACIWEEWRGRRNVQISASSCGPSRGAPPCSILHMLQGHMQQRDMNSAYFACVSATACIDVDAGIYQEPMHLPTCQSQGRASACTNVALQIRVLLTGSQRSSRYPNKALTVHGSSTRAGRPNASLLSSRPLRSSGWTWGTPPPHPSPLPLAATSSRLSSSQLNASSTSRSTRCRSVACGGRHVHPALGSARQRCARCRVELAQHGRDAQSAVLSCLSNRGWHSTLRCGRAVASANDEVGSGAEGHSRHACL
eukprot:360502-Chlamydomonas_euryale.AAC.3